MPDPSSRNASQGAETPSEDRELLRRYAEEKSEVAFAELVRRHVNFVYACALRRVGGDAHLAEDVTQHVFTALARDAVALAQREVLSGWLFTTARNASAQVVRTERRRQVRETEAQLMNELTSSPAHDADWERLRPVIDDALDRLSDDDRQAVLLRFFEGKSFADVGAKLRLTENTARMRVDRALAKLHALLARRGVTSTTAALGLALANQAGVAAPAGLAASVTGAALAGGGAVATGAGSWTLFMGITKFQIGIAAAIAVASATGYIMQAKTNAGLRREIAAVSAQLPAVAALRAENQQLASAVAEGDMLRRDDVELKQLAQRVAELKAANMEKTRLAQAVRVQIRRKELEDGLREQDRLAQLETDRMNREGNALVEGYKYLTTVMTTDGGRFTGEQRVQLEARVKAKLEEIQAKQREIKAYIENFRRVVSQSPEMQELRGLPPDSTPPPADPNWFVSPGVPPGTIKLQSGQGVISDEQGSLEFSIVGDKRELVAKNTKGEQIFSGPINTAEERQALPEDVRKRLEDSERAASNPPSGSGNWKLIPRP